MNTPPPSELGLEPGDDNVRDGVRGDEEGGRRRAGGSEGACDATPHLDRTQRPSRVVHNQQLRPLPGSGAASRVKRFGRESVKEAGRQARERSSRGVSRGPSHRERARWLQGSRSAHMIPPRPPVLGRSKDRLVSGVSGAKQDSTRANIQHLVRHLSRSPEGASEGGDLTGMKIDCTDAVCVKLGDEKRGDRV